MSPAIRALLAGLGLLASAAVQAQAKPLPTYTPAYEPRSVDERGMWMMADEYERVLRNSPLLIKDPGLQRYVQDVLCDTIGKDRCNSVRIYLLEAPVFNASMSPNGVLIVNSGALLRLRSSAELGSVLAHEFAHFELRHSLEGFKQKRSMSDGMAWLQVLAGLSQTNMAGVLYSLASSMYQFNQEQEKAADMLGLDYLAQSKFPSGSAADVWRNLMAEHDATAAGRKQKAKHSYRAGYFDTHPTSLARATYLAQAAVAVGDASEDPERARHAQSLGSALPKLLAAQNGLNNFAGTEYLLSSLAADQGWTPDLLFARGEMYRLRANPRDMVTASSLYREAIDKGYAGPEVHRNLGLSLLKSGQAPDASVHLKEYLRLLPDAADRDLIQTLVQQ